MDETLRKKLSGILKDVDTLRLSHPTPRDPIGTALLDGIHRELTCLLRNSSLLVIHKGVGCGHLHTIDSIKELRELFWSFGSNIGLLQAKEAICSGQPIALGLVPLTEDIKSAVAILQGYGNEVYFLNPPGEGNACNP